jgi:hypothetical protein
LRLPVLAGKNIDTHLVAFARFALAADVAVWSISVISECPINVGALHGGERFMAAVNDERAVAFEVLKRLGGKWAVLAAMSMSMSRKGIAVPLEVHERLRMARLKIGSGCFSPCEASCALADVEGQLFSQCHLMDEQEFMDWSNLLGEAMQGKLDYERIAGIPTLAPVRNDCQFLGCSCAHSAGT